ncbi:MAG: hypothetical protein CVU44_05685 [Chloroflexi bacterium HGW-Chloroflexi-6]|nr:MAG: hypothetical protein CVU44_05685 [Chloroflexi bacterium HGW-Chloroflexi-6]
MPIRTRALRLFLIIFIISLALPQISFAQSQASAVLYEVNSEQFPLISGLLDVYDEQGQFLRGLKPGSVSLLEGGETITPDRLTERAAPLQVVVAINSGPALAVRDGQGFSRYDKAIAVLDNWAAARPSDSADLFSLTWNGGIVTSRVNPLTWRNRLELFDPQLRASTPNLAALSYALDTALETPLVPGGKRAILLVSSHLDSENIAALNDLTARANQAGIRVFAWIVDSKDFLVHPGADALRQMAIATGGATLDFTGIETLLDPEEWLGTLRWVYEFEYASAVRESGQHSLSVLISSGELALNSNQAVLDLTVLPPNPILLSPPSQITRQNPEDQFDLENSQPASQALEILIEFPDGHPRPLERTTLYVDDVVVQENTSDPFEQFNWDLRGYLVSGTHSLRIEAVDSLGLSSTSAPVTVDVVVVQPPGGLAGLILRNNVAIATTGVVFAGLVLLVVIFFSGQKTFSRMAERRRIRARQLDPVTQPVQTGLEPPTRPLPAANPFPWIRRKTPPPPAYLVKLTSDGQPAPGGDPISLSAPELTIGADPTQATNVLGDPSLSPLHARIQRTANGFLLTDNRSIAGTWVNYETIPQEGCLLAHGDVVNFGQLTYRFVLGKPPAIQKPKLTPIQPE